jgi:AcrR family transcriptional regulator
MSRAKEHGLIWLRPEPNERRPRLSREQITAAVLKIADSEGFEAVTMKRIAEELDCATMTLYYYVRNKGDIVALMHDVILGEILITALPADWREAVSAIARRTRDVLLRHPWSVVSLNDAQFGPNAMRHLEQSLEALDGLDLDPAEKLAFWGVVDDYVFGSALRTVELLTRAAAAEENPTLLADAMTFGRQQLATGQFPRIAALDRSESAQDQSISSVYAGPGMATALAAQFERGLSAILDGVVRGERARGSC